VAWYPTDRLAGGTPANMLDAGKFRQPIQDVFAEWKTEEAVLARVTSGPTPIASGCFEST
jgi:hypothetical protein